jgi:Fe-S-cluster containining protein
MKFICKKCAACCKGPGYVRLHWREFRHLKDYHNLSPMEYYYDDEGEPCLVQKTETGCIMLKNDRCLIYACRPEQCRTFPFWNDVSLREVMTICPGVDDA